MKRIASLIPVFGIALLAVVSQSCAQKSEVEALKKDDEHISDTSLHPGAQ